MSKPIKLKIDVTKIDKKALFRANSGAIYLDVVAWPVDESRYGESHLLKQDFKPGEGPERPPIIGNMKIPEMMPPENRSNRDDDREMPDAGDDIPF